MIPRKVATTISRVRYLTIKRLTEWCLSDAQQNQQAFYKELWIGGSAFEMSLKYQKFLIFGDSITEFAFNSRMLLDDSDEFSLGAALVDTYTRKMDIVQRGFCGYTSRWASKILPHILEHEGPDVVLAMIFFGTNDAALKGPQKVDLVEFVANTQTMLDILKENGIKPILVGPGLHDKDNWEPRKPENTAAGYVRTNENNKKYSDALEILAREKQVPFVNLYEAFCREGGENWRTLLCDGIHYTGKGYQVFFNELLKSISKSYPEYAPENMEYKLPRWDKVNEDGSCLEAYF